MSEIGFPLRLRRRGESVAALQDGLQHLLDSGFFDRGNAQVSRGAQRLPAERGTSTFGSATRDLVTVFQTVRGLEVTGAVDAATARALNQLLQERAPGDDDPTEFEVCGTVRYVDASPVVEIRVCASDRDLRSEQPLGECETDEKGFYRIHYSWRQCRRRERGSADIVVRAYASDKSLLVASPVLFNAPPSAVIDLIVPRDVQAPPTLFEKLQAGLEPLLGELGLSDLREDERVQDVSFLAGESGFEKLLLVRFLLADCFSQNGIRPPFWFALLGSSSFQFTENETLSQQLEQARRTLPVIDATTARKALLRSFNANEIATVSGEIVDAWVEEFLRIAARLSVDASKPGFVKLALDDAGIRSPRQQEQFARLLNQHGGLTAELLDALAADASFEQPEVADLRASFRLADLTEGDFSVVKAIKETFNVREPEAIRGLARVSEAEWVRFVTEKHSVGAIDLPIRSGDVAGKVKVPDAEIYGRTLARRFTGTFPTAAFTGGLERALQSGQPRGLPNPRRLNRFLDLHQDFEFLNTPVDEFLDKKTHADFKQSAIDPSFRRELKAAQRTFKLAPTFEATDTLLADDLHSAQKVYRIGRSEFVRRYRDKLGFTAASAQDTWGRAADTHAAAMTIVADLKALDSESLPAALQGNSAALTSFPNWNNLFQSGDLCECEHCRSVLGPAAYFADILMFLKDRTSVKPPNPGDPPVTAKDILFDRRPDLGFIELNCDNALTPLPYVDVVCEVLEDVIAPAENDIELPGFTVMPPGTAAAKAAVLAALAAPKIDLGANFTLSQVKPSDPNQWVVHSDEGTYLLRKKATPNFFVEILRNTKASAAELRSYPQYVNPKAYDKLRQARYPSTLPFDLFAEEVRAAFQKCNLQRWDLMRTLHGGAPNNATEGEIAAEYFGISADATAAFDEKRLILDADPLVASQQTLWGETGASWLTQVGNVKKFLSKTRLEYNELLALLDLKFINPTGNIVIHHLDSSCDTEKKVIEVLDAIKLDRIHRFLRLWRKLNGWKMWELDLALRHPRVGNGALNEAFLIKLFELSVVKKRLGSKATVEQTLAQFGNLNTETTFTKQHEKRAEGLYQKLFLNKRLIKPLDPAFDVAAVDVPGPTVEKLAGHRVVVMAALGMREADLIALETWAKPSNGLPYISDDLTLGNLSFLWRHAWLAKQLKLKAEDWRTTLEIFHQDFVDFTGPRDMRDFLEKLDHLKATGFKPDELRWILSADRSAKAATKEVDAARFLATLRKELQAIQAEYDPASYDFLTTVPRTDIESLTALLTSLLQKLNRDEAAAQFFIATLHNDVVQELAAPSLPGNFTFPATITGPPNNIPIRYERTLGFPGEMTPVQKATLLTAPTLAAVTGIPEYQDAIEKLAIQPGAVPVSNLPNGFTFPATITGAPNHIPIRYDQVLRFTGTMTTAQRTTLLTDASLAAVTGIVAYQEAIIAFFEQPRAALKFFEPVFTTALEVLPATVDFALLSAPILAAKISYDSELRLLRFAGVMAKDEQAALKGLSPDLKYSAAVDDLFAQPSAVVAPDRRIWLLDADLQFPLHDAEVPANDNLATNLAAAAAKALKYLSASLSNRAVNTAASAQLQLAEALTEKLLSSFKVVTGAPPKSVLEHLTTEFVQTSGAVDYTAMKLTFDSWFWATRVAVLWEKWKLTFPDLERLLSLGAGAQLLDFTTLPLDNTGGAPSLDRFLRTARIVRLRDSLPEPTMTFLEMLQKLDDGAYGSRAALAVDVEKVNDAWTADDVEKLSNAVDLVFPVDYLLAESWERLRRAFYFLDNLNGRPDTVRTLAAASMGPLAAKTVKDLLRSKFGEETWPELSAEIQDTLRERKRDALSTYILSRPMPADAPSQKWENTNDLYAYYLLDVEMCACQLTSRLVQASGSVQLFVQRCFMGLEPMVPVKADGDDGDSAWRWWKWMRKYRVWEANRKVFLWPENWIEPELKKDRSQFFKDLENELVQNEVNQFSVEIAFTNYLDKLDGVAQLEIAGFYHEDDADETIVHVFARTTGGEPHVYYYRRYDYRQWTPWERIDLDIPGDYLIPAVVGKRLFLFWPVFTEVPDEKGNKTIKTPDSNAPQNDVPPAKKKLRLQMAVSDYRLGKWTPRRVSHGYAESTPYEVEIVKRHYEFYPIDRSDVDGRFGIKYSGYSLDSDGTLCANLSGAFDIASCTGAPEPSNLPGSFFPAVRAEIEASGERATFLKWVELSGFPGRQDFPENDFTLTTFSPTAPTKRLLQWTPDLFRMSPPWHLSYFDRLWLDGLQSLGQGRSSEMPAPRGSWLPFFYNDNRRQTFFVLPSIGGPRRGREGIPSGLVRFYYPEVKRFVRQLDDYFEAQVRAAVDAFDLTSLTPAERQDQEQFLFDNFSEVAPPPFTDEQFRNLAIRFFMRFVHLWLGSLAIGFSQFSQFHFKNFYHPFVCDFLKLVYNPLKGIPALMRRETQLQDTGFSFKQTYQPTFWVVDPSDPACYPRENVDFTPDGAYSPYNWELFFHAPLFIANQLSKNQRFEEARDWYHYIFNPVGVEGQQPGGSVTSKYWITKPFFETTDQQYIQQRIDHIMLLLAGDTSVPGYSAQAKSDLEAQVRDWRTNPFEPHRIANYRTVAYQKTAVMRYLDNLVAWGDYLFRQDSMESINEATQLYILAAEILGPRPKRVPPQVKPPVESFNELEEQFDVFTNALVEVENLIPAMPSGGEFFDEPAPIPMLYFCIPQNEKMLVYWDTVADRLYKIRHCMNIEGVVRQLALFEPPIDPAALVKAVAGGLDISTALADLNAPLPLYRFNVLLQKANEVCNDVKALGGALLTALEKKDAEALTLLRQTQEIHLLEAVKVVREKQIAEAKENLAGTKKSKELTEIKRKFYEGRDFMNPGEIAAIALSGASTAIDAGIALAYVLAGGLRAVPQFMIGAAGIGGSPQAGAETGGKTFGDIAEDTAKTLSAISHALEKGASIASTVAGYQRRQDDWDFQKDLAIKEIEQLDKQIAASELRIAIGEKELENQVLQIENAKAIDEFMHTKYTNQELYQWQVGQIAGVYFQSYKLAYDLAKRAERCARFELGLQDSSYISFGYWDSLKKGLLSGEKLQYDLRRLESAYLEQNRREFELTKHVSLSLLDPLALMMLRETGRCFVQLPEEIVDLDYPGHYFRRLKSVSLTLPCVAGPYTTISCTLRLLSNSIRINTANGDNGYARNTDDQGLPADDVRFIENSIPVKAVATSNAQNDTGVFELSFRDERYLPFEGAGVVSQWAIELFSDLPANNPDPAQPDFGKPLRQYDYKTISDVVLHLKYTAREDAGPFKSGAIQHLRDYFSEDGSQHSFRMFDLRQEFPTQWYRFLNPTVPANGNVFELEMSPHLFPMRDAGKTLKVNNIWLLARCTDPGSYTVAMDPPLPSPPPVGSNTLTLAPLNKFGGLHFGVRDVAALGIEVVPTDPPVTWHLKMTGPNPGNLQADEAEDMVLVLGYEWEV